jgi:hypothetical protein
MSRDSMVADANGNPISIGSLVRVPKIPGWLIHDLPFEDVEQLKKIEDSPLRVTEIDGHGYIWLGVSDGSAGWFCVKPNEIEVIQA